MKKIAAMLTALVMLASATSGATFASEGEGGDSPAFESFELFEPFGVTPLAVPVGVANMINNGGIEMTQGEKDSWATTTPSCWYGYAAGGVTIDVVEEAAHSGSKSIKVTRQWAGESNVVLQSHFSAVVTVGREGLRL